MGADAIRTKPLDGYVAVGRDDLEELCGNAMKLRSVVVELLGHVAPGAVSDEVLHVLVDVDLIEDEGLEPFYEEACRRWGE